MKLNLGSGKKPIPGYLNIDMIKYPGVYTMDMMDLEVSILPGVVSEIMMIRVLEHIHYWEAKDLLNQCLKVLKPGGKIIIECPDLVKAAEAVANRGRTGPKARAMFVLYGDPKHKNPRMCHKWGYTPESLRHLLDHVGFTGIIEQPAQFHAGPPQDFRVEALKGE